MLKNYQIALLASCLSGGNTFTNNHLARAKTFLKWLEEHDNKESDS